MRNSLWPEFKITDENSPKKILEEQARYLSQATSQILHGEVDKPAVFVNTALAISMDLPISNVLYGISANNISYSLYIVAPRLSNYRYELLAINYNPIEYYPLMISDAIGTTNKMLSNENDYMMYLSSLFKSEKVNSIISRLINQSRKGRNFL